jgi:hypothetical protein
MFRWFLPPQIIYNFYGATEDCDSIDLDIFCVVVEHSVAVLFQAWAL